jgi:hypothetical protein
MTILLAMNVIVVDENMEILLFTTFFMMNTPAVVMKVHVFPFAISNPA